MPREALLLVLATALALGAPAQAVEEPRSAIGWLSDVISAPPEDSTQPLPGHGSVSPFMPGEILTSGLDDPIRNGVGTLSSENSGLPADMWADASALRVRSLFFGLRPSGVPAAQDLFRRLALAETQPPPGSGPRNSVLLARIDALMAAGMLEDARELIGIAGIDDPELFRRAFDIALLVGGIDEICERLRDSPGLSPTLPARVYCLARLGDWAAAALTLQLGHEMGSIGPGQEALLARFLDPQMFEGEAEPPVPQPLTTLDYVLREAVALPRPASRLPLAFLWPDAEDGTPLRGRIEARERLTRAGAMAPERLFEAYREGTPAASGTVWDRAAAVQALDRAFATMDLSGIARRLEAADALLFERGLRHAMAQVYARQLAALPREGFDTATRQRVGTLLLLAGRDEVAARWFPDNNDAANRYLVALARNDRAALPESQALAPLKTAAARGLTATVPPSADADRVARQIKAGQVGEAVVHILGLLAPGPEIDPGDLTAALFLLRAVGLEDLARRVAVETLLLLPEA